MYNVGFLSPTYTIWLIAWTTGPKHSSMELPSLVSAGSQVACRLQPGHRRRTQVGRIPNGPAPRARRRGSTISEFYGWGSICRGCQGEEDIMTHLRDLCCSRQQGDNGRCPDGVGYIVHELGQYKMRVPANLAGAPVTSQVLGQKVYRKLIRQEQGSVEKHHSCKGIGLTICSGRRSGPGTRGPRARRHPSRPSSGSREHSRSGRSPPGQRRLRSRLW